jgi:hypothetical protein
MRASHPQMFNPATPPTSELSLDIQSIFSIHTNVHRCSSITDLYLKAWALFLTNGPVVEAHMHHLHSAS